MLPVPGARLDGVLAYRDIADTQAMIDAAARYRQAVVIGGGLLGLEAANGLMKRGMEVTVVHVGDWLLERQLDAAAAGLLQARWSGAACAFCCGPRPRRCWAMPMRKAGPAACAPCASRTAARSLHSWW